MSRKTGDGVTELPAIRVTTDEFVKLEKEIKQVFRDRFYGPLLRILFKSSVPKSVFKNAKDDPLTAALKSGRVVYRDGRFSGKFDAVLSRALKELGASWNPRASAFELSLSQMPADLRQSVRDAEAHFKKLADEIDRELRQFLPAEIAGKVKSAKFFDAGLWQTNKKIDTSLNSITVLPDLSPERRKRIAAEWQTNMDRWITDFAEDEIIRLRGEIQKHVIQGGRQKEIVESLQRSYGVTERKAKFLARQETNLLMSKFKETRYQEAGINEYRWQCVAGSALHPVRPSHKRLEGKTFRFSDPPVTTEPGEPERRNNPGEDYNCRCSARPIVRGAKGKRV